MGRWYLAQLAGGASLEDVALIDLQVSQGENHAAAGLVVFQHPEAGLYQQLVTGRSSCGCSTRISTSTIQRSARPTNSLPRRSTKPATRKKGDIELLELIARDPQAFILNQGWASVSLDGERGLKELRALYEHLQARILEIIESLDTLHASPEMEIFHEVEQDESVIEKVTAAQREELESEITGLQTEAEQAAEEAR